MRPAASRLPDPGRLAEIIVELADGGWNYGSGYEVAPGLVLTAAHVLEGRDRALVRFDGGRLGERELDGSVTWCPAGLDLALVDIGHAAVSAPTVPFADPERAAGELPFRAVGFPLLKRDTAGDGRVVRDAAQIDGTIPLLADLKRGTLSLRLSGGAPRELPAGTSPWEGMSGAAVFSGGALVGVVAAHRLPEGGAVLAAVRIAAIEDPKLVPPAERDRFRRLLGLPPRPFAPLRADGEPASRQGAFLNLIDRHRVFGGREAELNRLTELAEAGPGGYVLVTGRSGAGKTALLTNWAKRRAAAGAATCVHFISRSDGTAGEEDTLGGLCEQLARVRGVPDVSPASLPDLEDRYIRLITEPLPVGERVVVVIDALDEAAWTPVPPLFPPPADGVVVILSAREHADRDWIDRLELPPGTPAITLGRLGAAEVAEVLASADAPPRLRTSEAVAAIVEKCGGEPYYLAMLVRDLKKGVLTVPAQLSRWPTGLRGYFDRWWNETVATDPQGVTQLLAYLLAAVGPVPRDDLVAIHTGDTLDAVTIDQVVERAQGHVIGDAEGGYRLAHPLFAEYLEQHRIDDAARAGAREALLAYCEDQLGSPTSYVLREFPGLLSVTGRIERLLELIDDPAWYDAQLAEDPSGGGYLAGVRVAWEASHRRAAADLAGGALPRWIGREVSCALAIASMRSRLSGIPPALLGTLARRGLWSERSLLAAIRDAPTPRQHARALEAIVADLSPAGLREALALARGLPLELYGEQSPRMSAMTSVIEYLAGDERTAAARELFALRQQMSDVREWLRFVAGPRVSRALPGELVRQAVRAAADLGAEDQAVALVSALHDAEGDAAVIGALAGINDPGCRAEVITALAGRLGDEGTSAAARLAAELPAEGPSGSPRARALGALVPWLAPDAVAQAQRAVGAVADDGWRAWAELLLAARRPADHVAAALRAAAELRDPNWRLRAAVEVLPMLDGEHYGQALSLALGALAAAEPDARAAAARALARHLSAEDAERALASLGAEIGTEELAALVPCLPDGRRVAVLAPQIERRDSDPAVALMLIRLLPEAAAEPSLRRLLDALAGESAPDPGLIRALAEHAPDVVLPIVRAAALRYQPSLDTWVRLLERSPVEDRDELLDAALGWARTAEVRDALFETASRAEALARLLPLAPSERFDDLLTETLAAAGTIADDTLRLRAEIALLAGLPADAQGELAGRTAELDEDDRIRTLRTLYGPLERPAVLRLVDLAEALTPARALGPLLRVRQVTADPAGAEAATDAVRRTIRRLPAQALAGAAKGVPDDLLGDVLERAAGLPPSDEVIEALIVLAARSPEQLRRDVLRLTVRLPTEPDPDVRPGQLSLRSLGLRGVAPFLDPEAAEQALAAIEEIRDPTSSAHAWVAVAARLPEPARSNAAGIVARLMAGQPAAVVAQLVSAYAAAATESSAALVADAFTTVREHARADGEMAEALHLLGPFLSPADAAAALDLTRRFEEPWRRLVCVGFVRRLAEDRREAVVAGLLPDVEAVRVEEARCQLLTALGAAAPVHLRGALLERALDAATALGEEGAQLARDAVSFIDVPALDAVALSVARLRAALAMNALNPVPPGGRTGPTLSLPLTGRPAWAPPTQEPIASTRQMPSGAIGVRPDPASGLMSIVQGNTHTPVIYHRREQLPAPAQVSAFESALARLRRANGDAWRALVKRLLGDLPLGGSGVLASVEQALGRRIHRAVVLQYLAPPLPVWFTPVPIAERARREADRSARLLHELISVLGELDLPAQHETWNELLTAFSADMRPFFLVNLRNMTLATLQLGDRSAGQAAAAAIRSAAAHWP